MSTQKKYSVSFYGSALGLTVGVLILLAVLSVVYFFMDEGLSRTIIIGIGIFVAIANFFVIKSNINAVTIDYEQGIVINKHVFGTKIINIPEIKNASIGHDGKYLKVYLTGDFGVEEINFDNTAHANLFITKLSEYGQ